MRAASVMQRYLGTIVLAGLAALAGCSHQDSLIDETRRVEAWRQQRVQNLTSENGWLTLTGLYWLKRGSNSFGRDSGNALMLDHPALPAVAGSFELQPPQVSFTATQVGLVTQQNQPVTQIDLVTDAHDDPTVLSIGSLRFYAIERAGRFGIRVRDTQHPARTQFKGLNYFPISTDWRVTARYQPYQPAKKISIVNILGMTEQMQSPGALVFEKDGKQWQLDAILEAADDTELFIMFTDATSGRASYGAGRYLYVPRPDHDTENNVVLDFNQAYNPPCAFTEFATCPLPPRQNRLTLPVKAGELKYHP